VIPDIDIWRAAQLMLKRYGDQAVKESAARATELTLAGDDDGAATWHRIMEAVTQLANTTAPGARALTENGAPRRPYRILNNYARHFDQA
jgi:ferric-dicitrate binding protein FerR (iron transport regulator)